MNTQIQYTEQTDGLYMRCPVVGLTSSEFQQFARKTICAITAAIKKPFKVVGRMTMRVLRYLDRKWIEAEEMQNRAQLNLDIHYARNRHYYRSFI